MMQATYVGTECPELQGKTAIVRRVTAAKGIVLAQFDDWHLGRYWSHAWTDHDALDFVLVRGPHQTLVDPSNPKH